MTGPSRAFLFVALVTLCSFANAVTRLLPKDTQINLGALGHGSNWSLKSDDAHDFCILQAPYFGMLHRTVRFTSKFISPFLDPTAISVDLKARSETRGAFKIRVFMADRTDGGYVYGPANQVLPDKSLSTVYGLFMGAATGVLKRHVGLDGSMAVRVEVQQVGFASVFTNPADFEYLNVSVAQ